MDTKDYLDSTGKIVNWHKFFSQPRDIYIRNLSESNISITIGQGENAYYVSLPMSPDPMNLTAEAAYEDLVRSQDFRKIANARDGRGRPLIQIMDEEEYRKYYDDRAASMQTSSDEIIRRAEQARSLYKGRVKEAPPEPSQRVVEAHTNNQIVSEQDVIRDRLKVLMHQVHLDVMDEQSSCKIEGRAFDSGKVKTTASKILTDITSMRDLTSDELEHIISKGYWPSVKRWATMEMQKLRDVPADLPMEADDGDAFIQRHGMAP